MVQGPRIELGSRVLQTRADVTRLAHLALFFYYTAVDISCQLNFWHPRFESNKEF